MDRFIETLVLKLCLFLSDLKSSMDRFIVAVSECSINYDLNLKSSMDRFIGLPFVSKSRTAEQFKIQYG